MSRDDLSKFYRLILVSTALTAFNCISLQQRVPFEICIPNEETRKAFEEINTQVGLVKGKDRNDLFKKLGI